MKSLHESAIIMSRRLNTIERGATVQARESACRIEEMVAHILEKPEVTNPANYSKDELMFCLFANIDDAVLASEQAEEALLAVQQMEALDLKTLKEIFQS